MHAQADVRSTGVQMLDSVLGRLEREIAGEASVLESGFSLCDAYALVFAQWSRRPQVRNLIEPTPRLHAVARAVQARRSEEHTSELQSLMRISYAVFCLKKKTQHI